MKTETEPKQTAMQRLIEKMKLGTQKAYGEQVLSFEYFLKVAESLLPEERKVIEGAHKAGQLSASVAASDSEATEYFTTKFKQ